MSNGVDDYGWQTSTGPQSCGYVTPAVQSILKRLKVRLVCDLGAGNGTLAGALKRDGFHVVGVEYDKTGVEIAREKYPDINFHNLGVQDDPAPVLAAVNSLFDAVVSTEVVEHLFSPHLLPVFARKIIRGGDIS